MTAPTPSRRPRPARRADPVPTVPVVPVEVLVPVEPPRPVDRGEVARFVERLGSTMAALGLQRLPSRVFAALMADDDGRMTSAELATSLNISPASVSGAVRYLTQMRMIHREREPGTRRDVYVIADDQWHDTLMNTDQVYGRLQAAFAEGVPALGGSSTSAGRRVLTSVEFLDFIMKEMAGIADRWDQRQARATGR